MQTITSSARLKEVIQILEVEQAIKGQALKQQFRLTYESLKPANLFLSALNDITSSPNVIDNVLGTTVGLVSGFISKKIFIGTSGNLFRKLIGSFMQFGVSNLVANHPNAIKTFGQFILSYINRKKEAKHSKRSE
jgi:hypothetical protein